MMVGFGELNNLTMLGEIFALVFLGLHTLCAHYEGLLLAAVVFILLPLQVFI